MLPLKPLPRFLWERGFRAISPEGRSWLAPKGDCVAQSLGIAKLPQ